MAKKDEREQRKAAVEVSRFSPRKNVTVGKPTRRKMTKQAMQSRMAACGYPGGFGTGGGGNAGYGGAGGLAGGFAGGGAGGRGVSLGSGGNFYSPELSTDFLELPQSIDEKRQWFRFFYRTDPFVGQAVDLHVELPLSKVRMTIPKAKDQDLAQKAYRFCTRWAKEIGLEENLRYIIHEYTLLGESIVFVEDSSPDMPKEVTHEIVRRLDDEGPVEEWVEREDATERAVAWLKENYRGWTDIQVIPPERVQIRGFNYTKEKIFELVPSSEDTKLVEQADAGDPEAERIVKSMPIEIVAGIRNNQPIRLNTDPDAGSFVAHLTRKKSQYETHGHSVLERCMRVLVYRDKIRQALTSIASRHMTPIRLVWVEDGDVFDVEALREQVDLALQDPDYSIVTNYQVHWEEMGSDQRIPDMGSEYDMTDRQLYAGLGVTESLLSGESSYSGDRINLEVINTRYMTLRESISRFVEHFLLKPMCRRMGFVEEDEDGNLEVVYPEISFTRLALRDNADTFDSLFNLYQKGSIDVDVILELLNVDPETTTQKVKEHLFTLKDSTFNELLRGVYGDVGRSIAENSNVADKIARELGLRFEKPPADEGGRF